ncbi:uncharacterized protein PV07_12834 [Cladophialophora immunda]|uniref:C2H2-type domain-containing protein n=1 Tax=Cladophialophora immunda TaxID=569365 RepID=A0A0D1Z231_9EURO|nr:uncharacterized protein PV07_12834 [Cladophialophora immunda]KIW21736.1 hypothetical protein PV07_12834 [Cladophialophora immunda]
MINPNPAQYSIVPASLHPSLQHLPNPSTSTVATAPVPSPITSAPPSDQARTSPSGSLGTAPGKKAKYPCPYAQSHNCQATFSTAGHAARHGKKHTEEKDTRHTHKGASASGSASDGSTCKSKTAITEDAQRAKQHKKLDKIKAEASRRSSLIQPPLSEATSIAPTAIDTPLNVDESAFYHDPPQVLMPIQTIPESVSPSSVYPPLDDDPLLNSTPLGQMHTLGKSNDHTLAGSGLLPPMPALTRGFSDLDTLAQAAERFDTSFYHQTL